MPKLSSQKAIEEFTELSLATCLREGYPITKIGNRWHSTTTLIEEFIEKRVRHDMETRKQAHK